MNYSCYHLLGKDETSAYLEAFNWVIYAYYIRTNQSKKAVKERFDISSLDLQYIIEKGLKLEACDFQMLDLLLENKTLDYCKMVQARLG